MIRSSMFFLSLLSLVSCAMSVPSREIALDCAHSVEIFSETQKGDIDFFVVRPVEGGKLFLDVSGLGETGAVVAMTGDRSRTLDFLEGDAGQLNVPLDEGVFIYLGNMAEAETSYSLLLAAECQ